MGVKGLSMTLYPFLLYFFIDALQLLSFTVGLCNKFTKPSNTIQYANIPLYGLSI